MDYRYFSDTNANYLVIHCENTKGPEQYQYRMLAVNAVEGLLKTKIRRIDGEQYLYYDITSKQNLEDLYLDRSMEPPFIRRLLYAVVFAGEGLDRYLLDDDCLLLKPEFIYYDLSTDQYSFIYYPGLREKSGGKNSAQDTGNGCRELFAFLSARADPADTQNYFILGQLMEAASYPGFRLQRALLDREYRTYGDQTAAGEKDITFLEDDWQEAAPVSSGISAGNNVDGYWNSSVPDKDSAAGARRQGRAESPGREAADPEPTQDHASGSGQSVKWLTAGAVLLAAAVVLELTLQKVILPFLDLSPWKLQVRAAVLTMIILSLFLAAYSLFLARKEKKDHIQKDKEDPPAQMERFVPAGDFPVSTDAVQTARDHTGRNYTGGNDSGTEFSDREFPGENRFGRYSKEDEVLRPEPFRNKLYGTGAARAYRFGLGDLPCTAGRDPGYADIVLRDPSVSPVHVRFEADEEQVIITDLGSFSGTWLNGEKLPTRTPYLLLPGDELIIGSLPFVYR